MTQNREQIKRAWKKLHNGTMALSTKELLLLEPFLEGLTDDLHLLGATAVPLFIYLHMDLDRVTGCLKARGK